MNKKYFKPTDDPLAQTKERSRTYLRGKGYPTLQQIYLPDAVVSMSPMNIQANTEESPRQELHEMQKYRMR